MLNVWHLQNLMPLVALFSPLMLVLAGVAFAVWRTRRKSQRKDASRARRRRASHGYAQAWNWVARVRKRQLQLTHDSTREHGG